MSGVSDTGLQKLAFATSLVALSIDQCKKIKGSGLKVLASLPKLRQLHAMHRAFSNNDNWTSLDDEARSLAETAIAQAEGRDYRGEVVA